MVAGKASKLTRAYLTARWSHVSLRERYVIFITSSLVISGVGVLRAVWIKTTSDGGQGGAIAAIVALCILFLRRDYGLDKYHRNREIIESKHYEPIVETRALHDALVKSLEVNSKGIALQNLALVLASIIGTLFWGFGEKFAIYIAHKSWIV